MMLAAHEISRPTTPPFAFSAVLPICSSCAISSTLSTADPSSRRLRRRAAVQLNLAFLDPPDPPVGPPSPAPIPWEQLDEAARRAALDILARLIARMLLAAVNGASHE
jgi:hypothetical protein